jgi:hypothetical protein
MDVTTITSYLNDFDNQNEKLQTSNSVNDFYNKWSLLIEMITGVSLNVAHNPLERYALANTCSMIIRQKMFYYNQTHSH